MKKYFAALSATALISVAPYALASSTDLTVTGLITPSACTPSLSGGGMVDNGKISAKDLKQTDITLVGTEVLQFTVTCNAPMLFALDSTDNKAGTPSVVDYFGLGLTDAGEKIGFVYLTGQNPIADTQDVRMIESDDNGASWSTKTWLRTETLTAFAAATGPIAPIAIEELAMDLMVNTYIARADSLTLTDEVTMDGSATIEVTYL